MVCCNHSLIPSPTLPPQKNSADPEAVGLPTSCVRKLAVTLTTKRPNKTYLKFRHTEKSFLGAILFIPTTKKNRQKKKLAMPNPLLKNKSEKYAPAVPNALATGWSLDGSNTDAPC